MAVWSGWLAVALVVLTGCVPLAVRLRLGKRAPSHSSAMSAHVLIGLATGIAAFLHTLLVVPALGDPGAVGGGMLALGAGGFGFFVLVAHTGLGFQLRQPKLRDRARKRRAHLTTALLVVAAAAVHTIRLAAVGPLAGHGDARSEYIENASGARLPLPRSTSRPARPRRFGALRAPRPGRGRGHRAEPHGS